MTASFVLGEGGAAKVPVFTISILKDSQIQGNPDYDPDTAQVPAGNAITWTNDDTVAHTVTSSADAGATFDSSLISAGATYQLDTAKLQPGTYDYMCIVHPWMQASFEIIEESGERLAEGATATDPNSIPETPEHSGVAESPTMEEPVAEEPVVEEPIEEPIGETPEETPTEQPPAATEPTEGTSLPGGEVIVSIPVGASTPGCETTSECFIPSSITVVTGSTVTWSNDDTAAHTVTSGKDATPDGIFDSSLFMAGKTFSHTFESAGEYPYYCLVHPWMAGSVTVE
jgi:plastocyanin